MTTLVSALERIRVEVGKKRLRIKDRFQDFDKLRSGNVTKDQFRRCLAALNCLVPDADFELFVSSFPGKLPNTVDYGTFSNEVDREEAPISLLSSLRSPPRALEEDIEVSLERVNAAAVQRILATGVDIFSFFKDFDKHKSGAITAPQFERCFPFRVDARVLQALKDKYADGKGNVLYHTWCQQIADSVGAAERARASSPTRTALLDSFNASGNFSPSRLANPGADATASELTAMIKHQMAVHKLRCEDVFADYDKTRTGCVTAGQFYSAVGRMKFVKFQLTQQHLETLAKAYGSVDTSGVLRVNYVAFLADVTPEREAAVAASNSLSGTLRSVTLGDVEERLAGLALEKVRKAIETCRISLKPALQDFDRSIKGVYQTRTCTKGRFLRTLATFKLPLTESEANLICKKYAVAGADGSISDDVNYVAFCADVETVTDIPSPGRSHTTLLPVGYGQRIASSAAEVLQKISDLCVARKIRISEFTRDFDPLRAGTIQEDKFSTALSIAGMPLALSEIATLQKEYASSRVAKHVDVTRFLNDVDQLAQKAAPAASGSYSSGSLRNVLGGSTSSNTIGPILQLTDVEFEQLRDILTRLADHVKARTLLLPPFFVDYDRHHSGRITKSQFVQTLSRHKLPLSEPDHHLLCRAYGDSSNPDMVLYRSFIGDIDDAENISSQLTIRSSNRRPIVQRVVTIPSPTESLVESTLAKVAEFIKRKNARLDEFFQDADALRHRCITSSRFRGSLAIVGLSLSEAELRALEMNYHTDRILNGIDYVAFVNEITARVVLLEEQQQKLQASATGGQLKASSDEADGDLYFTALIAKLKKAFAARRLTVRPMLQDFDKLRKGKVTETHFLSVLLSVGVRLEPREVASLRANLSQGEAGMIAYHGFCDAVDTSK